MRIKNIIYGIAGTVLAATMVSCAETWKEKTNNEWESRYTWSLADVSAGVLTKAYTSMSNYLDCYGSNFLDAATDNATTSSYSSSVYNLANGNFSATNYPLGNWQSMYNYIQYVNSFIENGLGDGIRYDKVDDAHDQQYKRQYYGEALFMRAYLHWQLLQVYGGKDGNGKALGVPVLKSFVSEAQASKFEQFARPSYAACVEEIIKDLDESMNYLPNTYSGSDQISGAASIGKPTSVAAAALKSRITLYAASPAFQDDEVVRINGMADFTVVDPATYQKGWETAALIADELIKNGAFGSDFYAVKATDLADGPTTTPAEFIWRRYNNGKALEGRHFPPYYNGTANTVPSQNLVDAYPMANGYPISDPASNYDPSNPYEGRDKRFYLTVYYHGATFGNSGKPINVIAGGKDSYTYNTNASQTGYYLAKGLSKKENMLEPTATSNAIHYTPFIRRAEIFLNFAEAANEAWGPTGNPMSCKYSAYDIIKIIREKSGGITDTAYLDAVAAEGKDAFRELIANERRLELAFENHRYFDMRRCLLKLDEPVYGVEVTLEDGAIKYTPKKVADRMYNGIKFYYGSLPYDELVKNQYLVNNLGWK